MNESLGLAHFLSHLDLPGRLVLALLVLASVLSWTLIGLALARLWRLRREARGAQAWLSQAQAQAQGGVDARRLAEAGTADNAFLLPLRWMISGQARLAARDPASGENNPQAREARLSGALKRGLSQVRARLEGGQALLATIASSAPFVGLLGTVWGIHHALVAIGQSGQSSLDKVAGPVGEALIMTGIGLAVAIPAAIAYNLLGRAARQYLADIRHFAMDAFDLLAAEQGAASTGARS